MNTSSFENGVFVHKMAENGFQTKLVQMADNQFSQVGSWKFEADFMKNHCV